MSQFFTSDSQSIGLSASASVLPMNIQDLFPLGLTGLLSLQSRDSQESYSAPQFKRINSLVLSLLYGPTLISVLILFHLVVLSFTDTPFFFFLPQIEGLWEPYIKQGYWCHFSNNICSLCVSVTFQQFSQCFKLFHYCYIYYSDL